MSNSVKVFKSNLTVKFREGDPAQIMFFGNVFSWAHDTFEQFIVDAGFQWKEWFNTTELMIPIRHAEADYEASFIPGQTYDVFATVKKLGNSSFTMNYVFKSASQVHAKVEMVHVVLDLKTKKPIAIPDLIRQRFTPYLETP
jgi:acyl-CoA thioester hydrolase/1,4-dihydroxy-2-naphthoyl-CoA hydrolase